MPPKKPPLGGASQKSLTPSAAVSSSNERKPQPPPRLPDPASVPPLWTPPSAPRELFCEWPSAAALAAENWGSEDAQFDDPAPPVRGFGFSVPGALWKRPSQFLAPIAEPTTATPTPPLLSSLAPVVPDAKHAKKAAPPPGKKNDLEAVKKPKASRYAHVVYIPDDHDHDHQQQLYGRGSTFSMTASVGVDANKTGGGAPPRRIFHDFRRVWSAEQDEDWTLWRQDEQRIARDKEHRERVYMAFEDATAFILNERPRLVNEDDVTAEDLEDDGQDDQDDDEERTVLAEHSPYGGLLPPAIIDVPSNAVVKPETPHGDVVQPELASYFRIVDQLYQQWCSPGRGSTDALHSSSVPYLWEAIYPQDASGVPVYNHAGKYSVRLFVGGTWRRVDVDDKLPVDDEGHILTVSSSRKNEIWPALLAKALAKVAAWMDVEEALEPPGGKSDTSTASILLVSLVISCLTGWKVTRYDASGVFAGNYQSLQEYLPPDDPSDSRNELAFSEAADALSDGVDAPVEADETETLPVEPKPRALLCCTDPRGLHDLAFRQASLLLNVVGDPGTVTIKTVNLNGPSSIAEEALSPELATFLLVHPPFRSSDLITASWTTSQHGVAEPFPSPAVQFLVVNSMKTRKVQAPGDVSAEAPSPPKPADTVDVVVTLTRTPPICSTPDLDGSASMAQHLGVDPRGSVILVEDLELEQYRAQAAGRELAQMTRRPRVFKMDTSTSTHLQLPRRDHDSMAFRVYPQASCRYGYSLLAESSNANVDWQLASTYWRNVWNLKVVEADGAYPVLLPRSWNILFKQSIELALPPAEAPATEDRPELHVELQLTDPDLSRFVHLSIVGPEHTHHTIPLSGLHAGVVLPAEGASYTLVVECQPNKLVPEGKWHLTVGSNRLFKHAAVHQPRLSVFSGVYTPNKPLVCLRDVVVQPTKTTSTSLQFELLDAESRVVDELSAKIEIVDLATGKLLAQHSAPGLVRLLQLPPSTVRAEDPSEDTSGYILQCGIDKTTCLVPAWAESVRPFQYRQPDPPKITAVIEEAKGEEESAATAETTKSSPPLELKWRLSCWSIDELKLEFDRSQELQIEAVRAAWAEAAKGRDAHGVSSRLAFLGNTKAAQLAMAADGLSDEQTAKCKARSEWPTLAAQRAVGQEHLVVLQEDLSQPEMLRAAEQFASDRERSLLNREDTDAFRQSLRDERATTNTKETRAVAVHALLQSFRDQRHDAEQQRRLLYTQRDQVLRAAQSHAAAV